MVPGPSQFGIHQSTPQEGKVNWDVVLPFFGAILSAISALCAFASAMIGWVTWRHMRQESELSRPCIGESHWEMYDGVVYGKVRIWPGRHFVQTKEIRIPGYKISYVRHAFINGRNCRYSTRDYRDSLLCGVSVPVNGDAVDIEFAVSSKPVTPFKIIVDFAMNERPIECTVLAPLEFPECA